jgi:hypothetical protein
MYLAFYKGLKDINPKADIVDYLICKWTKSIYSHVEIVFSTGISFSSSPRDGGCRYKAIVYDDAIWDYIDLSISKQYEDNIMKFCNSQNGKGYDWTGIFLSQIFPLDISEPNKWTCSELVAKCLNYKKPSQYNPGNIYTKVKNDSAITYKKS